MTELVSIQGELVLNELLGNVSEDLALGDIGYEPSQQEIEDTCQKFIELAKDTRKTLHLIYIHKMYEKEPYCCGSVTEFVEKYTDMARPTFYRLINQININTLIYGEYDPVNPKIKSVVCEKLNSALCNIGPLKTIELWHFLNVHQEEKITGNLVDLYLAISLSRGIVISRDLIPEDQMNKIKSVLKKRNKYLNIKAIKHHGQDLDDAYEYLTSNQNEERGEFGFDDEPDEVEPDEDELDEDELDEDELDEDEPNEDEPNEDEPDEDEPDEENKLSDEYIDELKENLFASKLSEELITGMSTEQLLIAHKAVYGEVDPFRTNVGDRNIVRETIGIRRACSSFCSKTKKFIPLLKEMSYFELNEISEVVNTLLTDFK